MSTKATIAYGPTFHLYHEMGDERYVYFEVEGVPFEASYARVMVPIPVHVWEHARQFSGVDLSLADATDDELQAEVEAYVDERIARYEAATNDRERAFASVIGSIGYGPADAPREEQVAQGMQERTRRRTYQREVRAAIEQLSGRDDAPG